VGGIQSHVITGAVPQGISHYPAPPPPPPPPPLASRKWPSAGMLVVARHLDAPAKAHIRRRRRWRQPPILPIPTAALPQLLAGLPIGPVGRMGSVGGPSLPQLNLSALSPSSGFASPPTMRASARTQSHRNLGAVGGLRSFSLGARHRAASSIAEGGLDVAFTHRSVASVPPTSRVLTQRDGEAAHVGAGVGAGDSSGRATARAVAGIVMGGHRASLTAGPALSAIASMAAVGTAAPAAAPPSPPLRPREHATHTDPDAAASLTPADVKHSPMGVGVASTPRPVRLTSSGAALPPVLELPPVVPAASAAVAASASTVAAKWPAALASGGLDVATAEARPAGAKAGVLFDPLRAGRVVRAVFAHVAIPHFADICRVLGDDCVPFTNRVAKVVHDMCLTWGGQPIANGNGTFLCAWVLDDAWDAIALAHPELADVIAWLSTDPHALGLHDKDGRRASLDVSAGRAGAGSRRVSLVAEGAATGTPPAAASLVSTPADTRPPSPVAMVAAASAVSTARGGSPAAGMGDAAHTHGPASPLAAAMVEVGAGDAGRRPVDARLPSSSGAWQPYRNRRHGRRSSLGAAITGLDLSGVPLGAAGVMPATAGGIDSARDASSRLSDRTTASPRTATVRLASDPLPSAQRSSLGRGVAVAGAHGPHAASTLATAPSAMGFRVVGGDGLPAGHSRHSSAGPLLASGGGGAVADAGSLLARGSPPSRAGIRSLGPVPRSGSAMPPPLPVPAIATAPIAADRHASAPGGLTQSSAGAGAAVPVDGVAEHAAVATGAPSSAGNGPAVACVVSPSPIGVPLTPMERSAHQPATTRAAAAGVPHGVDQDDAESAVAVARARALMMEATRAIADQATLFAVKTVAALWRHKDVQGSREVERLWNSALLRGYRLHPAIGLHMGWAIEGAFGSGHKVDPTFFSQHVTLAAKLAHLNQHYGTHILTSSALANRVSPAAASRLRKIDSLLLASPGGDDSPATAGGPSPPQAVTLSLHSWDCVDWRVTVPPALAAALADRFMREVIALQRATKPMLSNAGVGGRLARITTNGPGSPIAVAASSPPTSGSASKGGPGATAAPMTPMATFAELAASGTLEADAFVSGCAWQCSLPAGGGRGAFARVSYVLVDCAEHGPLGAGHA